MKKYNYFKLLLLVTTLSGLFITCSKYNEESKSIAQNIYLLDSNFKEKNWFLSNNELGILFQDKYYPFQPNKLSRMGFNFGNKQFTNISVNTFPPFWEGGVWRYVRESKVFQLNKTNFLQVNEVQSDSLGSKFNYNNVYITNSYLNKKNLIENRDSSYKAQHAYLLPDNRIIFLERSNYSLGKTKLSLFNLNNKTGWDKKIDFDYGNLVVNNAGLIVTNNSICGLQILSSLTVIFSYDFDGNLNKVNKMYNYQQNYRFSYLLNYNDNRYLLTGYKYNEISKREDLCLLTLNANLEVMEEKIIPIANVLSDWDFYKNIFGGSFSSLIPMPIMVNNNLWMAVPYYTNKSGSSLKLIKFNQALEVETVKPIITNIPQNITNVGIKSDDESIYLGGINSKGAFFYRLDKNGDFK